MRTTIDIPDELFREAKLRAVRDGLRLKELLRRFVEQGLMSPSNATTAAAQRNRSELPVISTSTGKTFPVLTNAELYKIMDDEDSEKVSFDGDRSA